MTVLIVGDDKNFIDKIEKYLKKNLTGAVVVLYESAYEAISFAAYHEVDAVYTIDSMEEMSGQEMIEKIRRFKPDVKFCIIDDEESLKLVFSEKAESNFSDNCSTAEKQELSSFGGSFCEASKEALNGKRRNESRDEAEERCKPYGKALPASRRKYGRFDGAERGLEAMTDKELRSLNRQELLEIMLKQGKELETIREEYSKDIEFLKTEHKNETDVLKKELEEARASLKNKEIILDEAGSIAVAALRLNGIFEAAQAASQQYIENIRSLSDRQKSVCAKREEVSRTEADKMLNDTVRKCRDMENETREKCLTAENETQRRCEEMLLECRKKCSGIELEYKERYEREELEHKKKCEAVETDAKNKANAYWNEVLERLEIYYEKMLRNENDC